MQSPHQAPVRQITGIRRVNVLKRPCWAGVSANRACIASHRWRCDWFAWRSRNSLYGSASANTFDQSIIKYPRSRDDVWPGKELSHTDLQAKHNHSLIVDRELARVNVCE